MPGKKRLFDDAQLLGQWPASTLNHVHHLDRSELVSTLSGYISSTTS